MKSTRKPYEQVVQERALIVNVAEDGRLAALLVDPKITVPIANAQQSLYELLTAWQREITSPSNVTGIGPLILAIKTCMDLLDTVARFGVEDQQKPRKPDDEDDNT